MKHCGPPQNLTSARGRSALGQRVLRAAGVTDFARYRCDPAVEPPRVPFDFKVAGGKR